MSALTGARAALPGEDVLAAALFTRSSGRDRNVVLAITPTHVHLFKGRMTGAPVGPPFASWPRAEVWTSGDARAVNHRLNLRGPGEASESLSAPKRRPDVQQVLAALAGTSATKPAGAPFVPWAEDPQAEAALKRQARTVSGIFLAGAAIMVGGTFLPWLHLESIFGGVAKDIAGREVVGISYYWLGAFALLEGISMFRGRQVIQGLGHAPLVTAVLALVFVVFDYNELRDASEEAIRDLPGVVATIGPGIWITAAGIVGMGVGGVLMRNLRKQALGGDDSSAEPGPEASGP